MDLLAEEVDVADPESEHLALAQATPCGHDRGRSVPVWECVDDCFDSLSRHGWILRCSRWGSLTDRALHGLVAMSRSSTAALNTLETLVKIVRT